MIRVVSNDQSGVIKQNVTCVKHRVGEFVVYTFKTQGVGL